MKFFTGDNFSRPAELTFQARGLNVRQAGREKTLQGQLIRHKLERVYGISFMLFGTERFIGVLRTTRVA